MRPIKEGARIENPRGYSVRVVDHLRHSLEVGAPVQPDSRRDNFYEIDADESTYYIHVSPISGDVVLLAKWLRQNQECCPGTGCLVA